MAYWYKLILCENGTKTELGVDLPEDWHPPKPGQIWPVYLDGKQVHCEVISVGGFNWEFNPDGTSVLVREVFIQRPPV